MQPDDLAPVGFVHVGQAGEQQFDLREGEPVAVHARGVVGVELLRDRGRRGGGAGDGDAARDRRALVRRQAGAKDRAHVLGDVLQLDGVGRV